MKSSTINQFDIYGVDASRYKFVMGDLFDPTTIPKADVYILRNTLHCYNDRNVIAILSAIREACITHGKKNAVIFIGEHFILPPDVNQSNWKAHALDFILALGIGGGERTLDKYKQILQQSGLKFVKFYHTNNSMVSILEASINNVGP